MSPVQPSRMISYSVVARDEETGEELAIELTNLTIDSPLLSGVVDQLRHQGYPERVIAQFVPEVQPQGVSVGEGKVAASGGVEPVGQADADQGELVEDGKAPCPVCSKRFSTNNMARHVKTHSSKPPSFFCEPPCKFKAQRMDQVVAHQKTGACGM